MNKWEALTIVVIFISMFAALAISEYSKEKTKQYKIQYNCSE